MPRIERDCLAFSETGHLVLVRGAGSGVSGVVTGLLSRYIIWRNKHAADERLRKVVIRANVA
ncbi:hypothetical protein QFZ24_000176 [Streptomyces phaeochromogenes]|nr:hypothetical protein [Streptomyces phaeochromogenes]